MAEDKYIALGHPSYIWRFGQDRRLDMVRQSVQLENKRILDIGCGIGVYMSKFRRFSDEVYGIDVDWDRVREGRESVPNICAACSEYLPFADNTFDVTFLHEVIEHVADDGKTIREAYRVTKEGGKVVIYAPNRLYPFETHGFYLGKRYVFRLLPLVNYLPDFLRRIFVPHVRTYFSGDIRRLFDGLNVSFTVHTYVYPGFDKVAARRPLLAKILRRTLYLAENTPFRIFGLSHFLVVTKIA